MYNDSIRIINFRTLRKSSIGFTHTDQDFEKLSMPIPGLPNVNLVLGSNGFGKTTLLKAVALAALGPAVGDSGILPYRLVRREPVGRRSSKQPEEALIEACFTPHPQDHSPKGIDRIVSQIVVRRREDLESLRWTHPEDKHRHPVFSSTSDAFFFGGLRLHASRRTAGTPRSGRPFQLFVCARATRAEPL